MRTYLVVGVVLAGSAVLTAQSGSTSLAVAQTPAPVRLDTSALLTSCVQVGDVISDRFALPDKTNGTIDRHRWTKLGTYAGRPISVVGGLLPTANIAAQMGAIDSTIVSMAAMGRIPTANSKVRLPALRVTRVQPLLGSCVP